MHSRQDEAATVEAARKWKRLFFVIMILFITRKRKNGNEKKQNFEVINNIFALEFIEEINLNE